ncbi:MAG: OmpH family outer membrane protein [Candidatus Omnitrophica bacterium]|nr:OmpH family outer membrane protein [Candidatus Omnitrophota bacterium]
MKRTIGRVFAGCATVFLGLVFVASSAFAAKDMKIGHVDLRRAFYEYEKSKTYDKELSDITTKRGNERTKLVDEIKKLSDEAELLSDDAKAGKQKGIDAKIGMLNEFDRNTRQELLSRKNDMFREVIDDIQKIVVNIGKKEKYDYILDSRNIMYAEEAFDLTDRVLKELNK